MLTGRVLRTGVVRFVTTAELAVEFDIALPGRDVDMLFGVISPERSPRAMRLVKKESLRYFVSGYKKRIRLERRQTTIAADRRLDTLHCAHKQIKNSLCSLVIRRK